MHILIYFTELGVFNAEPSDGHESCWLWNPHFPLSPYLTFYAVFPGLWHACMLVVWPGKGSQSTSPGLNQLIPPSKRQQTVHCVLTVKVSKVIIYSYLLYSTLTCVSFFRASLFHWQLHVKHFKAGFSDFLLCLARSSDITWINAQPLSLNRSFTSSTQVVWTVNKSPFVNTSCILVCILGPEIWQQTLTQTLYQLTYLPVEHSNPAY